MSFLELAKKRCSVRSFEPAKVEEEKVRQILEAGRIAPTAANVQPQSFLVINNEEGFDRLKSIGFNTSATLVIIICGNHKNVWTREIDGKSMLDVDATIATDHMMMEAQDLGLGSCWLTYFNPAIIKEEFNLPDNLVPVNILALGYADGAPASPERHSSVRKPLDSMVVSRIFRI